MGEIKVQITSSKPKILQVSSKNVKNSVQIEENPTHYYSTLAKQWAVKIDGLVQNEDYSSKYWAINAKKNADIAENSVKTNQYLTEILNQNYLSYNEDLNDTYEKAIDNIQIEGETQVEKIKINAGAITEALATKTDKVQAGNASCPSSIKFLNLTLGLSGETYVAPADGYLTLAKYSTATGQYIQANGTIENGNNILTGDSAVVPQQVLSFNMKMAKGQKANIYYDAAGDIINFKFVYLMGSESEET